MAASGLSPEQRSQFNDSFQLYSQTGDSSHMQTIYNIFDIDGNGQISAQELVVSLQSIVGPNLPEERILQIFEQADVNHDGSIDFEEFCSVLKKYKVD